MKRWDKNIVEQARVLRREGYSFGQLMREFGVPKSTLHSWLTGIERPQKFTILDRKQWSKTIQPLAVAAIKQQRLKRLEQITTKVRGEVNALANADDVTCKAMLAMLYLAEGSKVRGTFSFANTDPRLILLFVTLFRRCFRIDEQKFRVRLHLHWYHNEKEAKHFWSELTHIPEDQFGKIYWKKRNKAKHFRKNFGGICFIRYNKEEYREHILRYGWLLAEKVIGKVDAAPIVQWIE